MPLLRARCSSARPSSISTHPSPPLSPLRRRSQPDLPSSNATRHLVVEAPPKLLTVHRESTVFEYRRRRRGIEFPCRISDPETPRGFATAILGRLPPACAGARSRMHRREIGQRGERRAAEIAQARYRDRPRCVVIFSHIFRILIRAAGTSAPSHPSAAPNCSIPARMALNTHSGAPRAIPLQTT